MWYSLFTRVCSCYYGMIYHSRFHNNDKCGNIIKNCYNKTQWNPKQNKKEREKKKPIGWMGGNVIEKK